MIPVFYSSSYVGSSHVFDTTRKAQWVADSLRSSPIPDIQLYKPKSLTEKQVLDTHSLPYLNALKTGTPKDLAESQQFAWDKQLLPMVLSSNGGVLNAAYAALQYGISGSLSSGLHHARKNYGSGFCTLNGLAIAANHITNHNKNFKVLIIDLDAHCGGGTQSLIQDNPNIWQLDISVDRPLDPDNQINQIYDFYQTTDRNILKIVHDHNIYLSTINSELEKLPTNFFDLVIYNAGMDPFEGCSIGGLPGISFNILAQREKLIFNWAKNNNIPIAFVLAGGYIGPHLSQNLLVNLHRLTLNYAYHSK